MTIRNRRWHAAVFATALVVCCAMASRVSAAGAPPTYHELVDILDVTRPLAGRKAALDEYRRRALKGEIWVQYVVGSLYRIGQDNPNNLLEKNADEAARFLSAAAAHGAVDAMAKMAEIEIARGRARGLDAMLWTQIYLYYRKQKVGEDADTPNGRSGYPADLLYRATSIYDASKDEEMKQYLASFITTHNADIEAGMKAHIERSGESKTQSVTTHLDYRQAISAMPAHYVDNHTEYVVAFDADGSATDAWLLDSAPDIKLGRELRAVAMRMRVNNVPGKELRYAIVPLEFATRRHEIRSK
jgi:hypothetical protein